MLHRGSGVLHPAADHESVSRAQLKTFSQATHFQMPTHNVDNLIVWMSVHRSSPAFHHLLVREKKFVVIGEHSAYEAGFRMGLFALVMRCHYQVRIGLVLRLHLASPLQRASAACSDLAVGGFRASFTSCAYRIAKALIKFGFPC